MKRAFPAAWHNTHILWDERVSLDCALLPILSMDEDRDGTLGSSDTPQEGEVDLEKFRPFATDHEANPYGIQWMRYETECPLPILVETAAHSAIEVKEVIIESNNPSQDVSVAMIVENGTPVEFIEYTKKKLHGT